MGSPRPVALGKFKIKVIIYMKLLILIPTIGFKYSRYPEMAGHQIWSLLRAEVKVVFSFVLNFYLGLGCKCGPRLIYIQKRN